MKDHLLFVDTETSGLPKDWYAPYSKKNNWPFIVQVAWVIYTKEGEHIKTENHYIKDDDYKISVASRKIHGITHDFLIQNGENRRDVMKLLLRDLISYQPLVVGHFMQLDYHMMGVGFHRSGLSNPVPGLPNFCTMKVTEKFIENPYQKFMKLSELHEFLFRVPMAKEHNALEDAQATAKCFFEMKKRGIVTPQVIDQQQIRERETEPVKNRLGWGVFLVILIICFILMLYLL